MFFKFLKPKWQKVTAAVLLGFIVFVLIPAIFVNRYWSPVLAGKVKDIVLKSTDGLYKVDFSAAELHILRGSISIYNITLKPDTAVYHNKLKLHLAPNNLVMLHVKRLTISHVHFLKLYFLRKLDIGKIVLNDPELQVIYQLNHTRDTVLKDKRTPWQQLSKTIRSLRIGEIVLSNVNVKYEDRSDEKITRTELKEVYLNAGELLIDSATQADRSRLLYCRDITAELNNYAGETPNGLYTYSFRSIKLSTLKSQLTVTGLTLKPVNADVFFNKSYRDRFTAAIDTVQLNHFDFLSFDKYRSLNASSLIVHNGVVEIFGNPRQTIATSDRVATFPNVGLFKIKTGVNIDSALLKRIDIIYSEYNTKTNKAGTLTFNNTAGKIFNITTDKADLQRNSFATVALTSYFMNRGRLSVAFNFNLTDQAHSFGYKGNLGPMPLQLVNKAVMPLAMLKITGGAIKQFNFDISANSTAAKGKVLIMYNGLKVGILKADTEMDKLKRQPIMSLFANNFILKHDNPDTPGGAPRSFNVDFNRDPFSPFFKFIWQTLLSGIKPAVGMDKKMEETTASLLVQKAINKKNRRIKKQLRIARRAERKRKKESQQAKSS